MYWIFITWKRGRKNQNISTTNLTHIKCWVKKEDLQHRNLFLLFLSTEHTTAVCTRRRVATCSIWMWLAEVLSRKFGGFMPKLSWDYWGNKGWISRSWSNCSFWWLHKIKSRVLKWHAELLEASETLCCFDLTSDGIIDLAAVCKITVQCSAAWSRPAVEERVGCRARPSGGINTHRLFFKLSGTESGINLHS